MSLFHRPLLCGPLLRLLPTALCLLLALASTSVAKTPPRKPIKHPQPQAVPVVDPQQWAIVRRVDGWVPDPMFCDPNDVRDPRNLHSLEIWSNRAQHEAAEKIRDADRAALEARKRASLGRQMPGLLGGVLHDGQPTPTRAALLP